MDLVLITAADKLSTPSSVLALKHVHTQAFFLQLVILAPYSSLVANAQQEARAIYSYRSSVILHKRQG